MAAGKNKQRKVRGPYCKRACVHCKQAKAKCDNHRPCRRCSKMGLAHECVDAMRTKKKRKKRVRKKNNNNTVSTTKKPVIPNINNIRNNVRVTQTPNVQKNTSQSIQKRVQSPNYNLKEYLQYVQIPDSKTFSAPTESIFGNKKILKNFQTRNNEVQPINMLGMDEQYKSYNPSPEMELENIFEKNVVNENDDKNKQIELYNENDNINMGMGLYPPSPLDQQYELSPLVEEGGLGDGLGDGLGLTNDNNEKNENVEQNIFPIESTNDVFTTSNNQKNNDLYLNLSDLGKNLNNTKENTNTLSFSPLDEEGLKETLNFDIDNDNFWMGDENLDSLPSLEEKVEKNENFENVNTSNNNSLLGPNNEIDSGNNYGSFLNSSVSTTNNNNSTIQKQSENNNTNNSVVNNTNNSVVNNVPGLDFSHLDRDSLEKILKGMLSGKFVYVDGRGNNTNNNTQNDKRN